MMTNLPINLSGPGWSSRHAQIYNTKVSDSIDKHTSNCSSINRALAFCSKCTKRQVGVVSIKLR